MNHHLVAPAVWGPLAGSLSSLASLAADAAFALAERIRIHVRHQRDYRKLLDMPEYLLRDIGITHEQVLERRRLFP